MNAAEVIALAAKQPDLLVATDFDGTIADITPLPEQARARPEALVALAALASHPRLNVAVISGRTRESLRALTSPLPPIFRVSEHGAFVEAPTGALLVEPAPVPPNVLDRLESLADDVAKNHRGLRVERKERGLAVHLREVEDAERPRAEHDLQRFRDAALAHGLSLLNGRSVIEARLDHHSKERALAIVVQACPRGTFVLYAGDDTTDEGAISLAHQEGLGIYIASAERPRPSVNADLLLDSPAAWCSFLTNLAAELR